MDILIAAIILLFCLTSTFVLLFHGIKGGLIEQKIIGDFAGNYLTGKDALSRGIVFIAFGVICLFGSIILLIYLYKNMC